MRSFLEKKIRYVFYALLLAVGGIWYAVFFVDASASHAEISFFDVGQGDAIFITAPNGNQVLIDGGPDTTILEKLGRVIPFWDRSIDLVVLTHPHADHLDGLLSVIARYQVGRVIESGVLYPTPEYREWHEMLAKEGIPVSIAEDGSRIILDHGMELDILLPEENFLGVSRKNVHDAMVVTRLVYGNADVLLMGDAERPLEQQLLAAGVPLASDILKVGHHGSKTSTGEAFLEAVHPAIAVISVGRGNRYGHPNGGVLDRLRAAGIHVFRTDEDGDILFESDGKKFFVR